tara:strand:+ start:4335 stop:5207 length:873 start_codon:yes stop_codon:yes gene_type:complete
MIELLEELFISLKDVLINKISPKDRKLFENNELDVLGTLLSLSKNKNDFRMLIESSSISKDEIIFKFNREGIDLAKTKRLIKLGSGINSSKYFISTNGLFEYYKLQDLEVNSAFIAFDDLKFPSIELKLKAQEKIWCVLLILLDATEKESLFDTTQLDQNEMDKYFKFFKIIETELDNSGISLGTTQDKKIGWGSGKDTNFRRFITNNVDLNSTGIYNNKPMSKYWIDFSTRKNVSLLLDLILDNYSGSERIEVNDVFYQTLFNLSGLTLTHLNVMPNKLNKFLVEELRG